MHGFGGVIADAEAVSTKDLVEAVVLRKIKNVSHVGLKIFSHFYGYISTRREFKPVYTYFVVMLDAWCNFCVRRIVL